MFRKTKISNPLIRTRTYQLMDDPLDFRHGHSTKHALLEVIEKLVNPLITTIIF